MADEEKKTPKPRAKKVVADATPEVSAEIPMMAEALTPDAEVEKPARAQVRHSAAAERNYPTRTIARKSPTPMTWPR